METIIARNIVNTYAKFTRSSISETEEMCAPMVTLFISQRKMLTRQKEESMTSTHTFIHVKRDVV